MKSLVYIDACMRKDSSTRRIAKPIISQLSERYTITKFVLNELPLEIVKEDRIQQRMHGNYDPQSLSWAKKIRDADQIVQLLRFGICRAQKLLYITTRGMDISTYDPFELATPYLKTLSWLWVLVLWM